MNFRKGVLMALVALIAAFGGLLSSCASIKILTPGAIETDIEGIPNLAHCQFFISKDVTLSFSSNNRDVGILDSGTVQAERTIIRRTIRVASSTPGILQIKNNAGDVLLGYDFWINQNNREQLDLNILFDEDNDNVICFAALYDVNDQRFVIVGNTVNYGGLTYNIAYEGDERPYLLYKLLERTKEQNEARKAKGRKVGS